MRIVSLLPSATEILFALGAGPEVVGVTHECDHPEPASKLPRVTSNVFDHASGKSTEIDRHIREARHEGSAIYNLDRQLLEELKPDLIVTQELCPVCAVAYYEVAEAVRCLDADVPILSLEPSSLDEILRSIQSVGEATGHVAEAGALVARLRERIKVIDDASRIEPPPRVACIEWTDPLMPGGHWVPEMVRIAGGEDVLWEESLPSTYIEWDVVRKAEPEVMVLMPCGFGLDKTLALAPEVTGRPGFDALACAQSGRVVAVDGSSYFNRPGPRIVDGLEILAAILHSEPGADLPTGAAWIGRPAAAQTSALGSAPAAFRT